MIVPTPPSLRALQVISLSALVLRGVCVPALEIGLWRVGFKKFKGPRLSQKWPSVDPSQPAGVRPWLAPRPTRHCTPGARHPSGWAGADEGRAVAAPRSLFVARVCVVCAPLVLCTFLCVWMWIVKCESVKCEVWNVDL